MMKEMSLTDIQSVSIEILKVIDEFCQIHNINYSLGYGTLIGAVRHKGCIPWDDDIDIIMTRSNYDKFINLFNDYKGYKLYAPELGNCYHAIARICEMKSTRVWKYYKWCNDQTGVWIDLFPYDFIPKDGGKRIRQFADICYAACLAHAGLSWKFTVKQNLVNAMNFLFRGHLNRKDCVQKYLEAVKTQEQVTENYRNYASPYNMKDIHKSTLFNSYMQTSFCSYKFYIIKAYDVSYKYLWKLYGIASCRETSQRTQFK